jgi:hypothetical protein
MKLREVGICSIINRIDSNSELKRRQLFEKIHKWVAAIAKEEVIPTDNCQDPLCLAWKAIYASRFGLKKFPCAHDANNDFLKDLDDLPVVTQEDLGQNVEPEFWEGELHPEDWSFSAARGGPASGPTLGNKFDWTRVGADDKQFAIGMAKVLYQARKRQFPLEELVFEIAVDLGDYMKAQLMVKETVMEKRAHFYSKWMAWGSSKNLMGVHTPVTPKA